MTRPPKGAALTAWILTLAGCAGTLFLGYNAIFAMAIGGLFSLVAGTPPPKVGNGDLLLALVPSAIAVAANLWVLAGRPARARGVSPWWVVASLVMAVGTFGFGVWVCIDVWEPRRSPA